MNESKPLQLGQEQDVFKAREVSNLGEKKPEKTGCREEGGKEIFQKNSLSEVL